MVLLLKKRFSLECFFEGWVFFQEKGLHSKEGFSFKTWFSYKSGFLRKFFFQVFFFLKKKRTAQPSRGMAPGRAVNARWDSIPRMFCTVVSLLHARAYGGLSWPHGDDTRAVDGWFTGHQQMVRAKVTVRPCPPLVSACQQVF